MIRSAHDLCLIIEILGDRLATMHARYKGWTCEVQILPLNGPKEGVVLDVFGVVRKDDVTRSMEITHTADADAAVVKYPIVLTIAF
jgi:hypothetical protein